VDKDWKRAFFDHVQLLAQHLPADNEEIQRSLSEDGNWKGCKSNTSRNWIWRAAHYSNWSRLHVTVHSVLLPLYPREPVFNATTFHMRFLVDRVALPQASLRKFRLPFFNYPTTTTP